MQYFATREWFPSLRTPPIGRLLSHMGQGSVNTSPVYRAASHPRRLQSVTTIRGQQGWVCYALLLGLSRAALSNGKCLLFSAFVSKVACFSMIHYLKI